MTDDYLVEMYGEREARRMTEKHWGYYGYFAEDPLWRDAITKHGNCRCGQVFIGQRPHRKMLPHKPAEYEGCYWADVPPPDGGFRFPEWASRDKMDKMVDELNAHRPGWDRKPSPRETHVEWLARHNMVEDPSLPPGIAVGWGSGVKQPDYRIIHAPGHCQAECAYVGHNVIWPTPTAKEWQRQQVFVSGRQNGKWAQFKEKAAQLEQYFVPEQIVDYGHTVGYYVQPRSVEVDRSFENEVRLHG